MLVKKSPAITTTVTVLPTRSVEKQLQALYARRSAVESLIASLEDYGRYRSRRFDLPVHDQKTA